MLAGTANRVKRAPRGLVLQISVFDFCTGLAIENASIAAKQFDPVVRGRIVAGGDLHGSGSTNRFDKYTDGRSRGDIGIDDITSAGPQ